MCFQRKHCFVNLQNTEKFTVKLSQQRLGGIFREIIAWPQKLNFRNIFTSLDAAHGYLYSCFYGLNLKTQVFSFLNSSYSGFIFTKKSEKNYKCVPNSLMKDLPEMNKIHYRCSWAYENTLRIDLAKNQRTWHRFFDLHRCRLYDPKKKEGKKKQ